MADAIIRGKNGRRYEVDFDDAPVRVEVHASEETVEIFVEADFETHPEERRRFAIINIPRLSLSETQSGWQVESNWVMLLVDERCLQPDLVGADRIVPVASVAASRDLDASSSAQRAAA